MGKFTFNEHALTSMLLLHLVVSATHPRGPDFSKLLLKVAQVLRLGESVEQKALQWSSFEIIAKHAARFT